MVQPPPILVIVQENRPPMRLPLRADVVIGRDPEVNAPLQDGYLSRRHCQFARQGDAVFVRDLGSYNGTYVNGTKIHEECRLYPGDVLKVGRTRVFVDFGDEQSESLQIHAPNLEPQAGVAPVSSAKHPQLSDPYRKIAEHLPPAAPHHSSSFEAGWGSATRRAVRRPNVKPDDKTPLPPPAVEDSAIARASSSRNLSPVRDRGERGLRMVAQLTRVLGNARDIHEFLDYLLSKCLELIPAERGIVMRLDPERRSLYAECVKSADPRVDDQAARRKGISHTIARKVIRERVSILVNDAVLDNRFKGASSVQDLQVRSILCVPLWLGEKVSGLIYFDHLLHAYAFKENDRDLLVAVANIAALGIQRLTT